MTAIRNIFNRGAQDKDSDKSAVPNGMTRHVENLRFHTNNGKDGIGVNIKGTLKVSDVTEGNTDLKCIGAYFNEDKDVIYYKLASSDGQISIDAEYDINLDTTSIVLKDTNGILKYDKKGYITGWNEIDGLQFWSEWGNNPRRINTERAKNYGVNGFTEDDITVIVYPPLQKLRLTLEYSETVEENNIKEKFLFFSYRYKYLDGEYSVLAPFTNVAFFPKKFKYDYSEQTNKGMINKFNQVKIEFNTGSERVVEIQLVFKESGSNREWIIDDFDKDLLGYGHNEIQSFSFNNLKSKRALPNHIFDSFFDGVPKTSKAQTIIEGRLIYGYYKEYYNLLNIDGTKLKLEYKVNVLSKPNTIISDNGVTSPSLLPVKTVKSNRDYEVKIAYVFDYGRITTLLESKTNTAFIHQNLCVNENSLQLELNSKPPLNATAYKIFIRQNKRYYDQILPSVIYGDGVYRWIKLEGNDKDKVKEGDYLIVKAGTEGYLTELTKVKVLDVTHKITDFLPNTNGTEHEGTYFKIKPDFRLDVDDYNNYIFNTYHNSRRIYENCIQNTSVRISEAHFYGDGIDDLSSGGTGVLGNEVKKRILIKIDNVSGTGDTFKWTDDVLGTGNWNETLKPITSGVAIPLSNGLEITFDNNIGHTINDEWYVNMTGEVISDDDYAYGYHRFHGNAFETMTDAGEDLTSEIVENGAVIYFVHDEYGKGSIPSTYVKIDNISANKYDNIEEWFYKENIRDIFIANGYTTNDFWFIRGVMFDFSGQNAFASTDAGVGIQGNSDGYLTLVMRSQNDQTNTRWVKVSSKTEIRQLSLEYPLLFETEPKDQPKEIFYEIGRTYKIENGLHTQKTDDWETKLPHIIGDEDQTASTPLKLKLDWHNAWSFGNAVESYKIKDDFNAHYLVDGMRVLTSKKGEYKEVTRISDVTWSDIYNHESNFNGLNTFNLSLLNFTNLDKEDGSIQKLFNANKNLLVYQEDAIGLMPYNRSVIQDVDGGKVVGISKDILNKDSYRPYAEGLHGISLNPESFVAVGSRKYSTDRVRGDLLRLSINGVTEINKYQFEHWFSDKMHDNKGEKLIGGYDPKHKEYYLNMPKTGTLVFTEKAKGFPFFLTIQPDFMLGANNEFYAWENGVMYRMNATENRNNFFGKQYNSVLKFFVNAEYQTEKIFKALGLESSHAWLCKLKTKLTSRVVPKESFSKKEDYFYSEIMGNTNSNTKANSIFGLGGYPIINGIITTRSVHNTMSVGDTISSNTIALPPLQVVDIQGFDIILSSAVTYPSSFLMYHKNQNIDGSPIRGDILEVEMISDETEKVEIRAVRTEAIKSSYS